MKLAIMNMYIPLHKITPLLHYRAGRGGTQAFKLQGPNLLYYIF